MTSAPPPPDDHGAPNRGGDGPTAGQTGAPTSDRSPDADADHDRPARARVSMGLSARIGLTAGVAVALAVILTSTLVYLTTSRTLLAELDDNLDQIASEVLRGDMQGGPRLNPFGGAGGLVQVLNRNGAVVRGPGRDNQSFPVSPRALQLATGDEATRAFETITLVLGDTEVPLRVATIPVQVGSRPVGAVQVAVPATQQLATLARLRRVLFSAGVIGTLLAAVAGWWLGRRATRPVADLTTVAEQVRATGDLTRRIEVDGDDELARLATTFNAMLAALERTQHSQTQLVSDASHELRTPLTSLRTNIEVLDAYDQLGEHDRGDLLRDVSAQLDEFGGLVDSLVALTRDARADVPAAPIALADLVEEVVTGMRPFVPPGRSITVHANPATVIGNHDSLARAVRNLVDNAIKYGEGTIEVGLATSQGRAVVSVADHGPGVAPAQRERIFDRFHRAPASRALPGSGLGLAIVAQSAARHNGHVTVDDASGGGALFRLELPLSP